MPTIQRLIRDFPECQIRVLIGSGRVAANDKVAKLARMTAEAKYETVVMSDSDVRVQPDYLRTIVAGLEDPKGWSGHMLLCAGSQRRKNFCPTPSIRGDAL